MRWPGSYSSSASSSSSSWGAFAVRRDQRRVASFRMPSRLLFLLPHSRVVDVIYCRCHAYAYAMGTEEAERYRCTRTHNSPSNIHIRVECVCVLAMIFFVLRCAYSRRYVQYSLFFSFFRIHNFVCYAHYTIQCLVRWIGICACAKPCRIHSRL